MQMKKLPEGRAVTLDRVTGFFHASRALHRFGASCLDGCQQGVGVREEAAMKITVSLMTAGMALALSGGMITAAYAADKPKVLVVFPYLGDQSFVRMHKAAEDEAKTHTDVEMCDVGAR